MRSLNAPTEPVSVEEKAVKTCTTCGAEVHVTLPAGIPRSLAGALLRMGIECEPCTETREADEKREEAERLRRHRLDASHLPEALRGLSWESYNTDRRGAANALAVARAWADGTGEKPGLMLCGSVGVGKTRLAATAAWAMLAHRSVRWVSVPELIVHIGAGFGDGDRARAMKVLTGSGALVLDDLDKVTASTWVLSNLFTAIDRRVQAGAPLLVTTNLSPKQLVDKFTAAHRPDADERRIAAEAIVSRLVGHCRIQGIDGHDGRRS
jgi:DNA replication protein DnaC